MVLKIGAERFDTRNESANSQPKRACMLRHFPLPRAARPELHGVQRAGRSTVTAKVTSEAGQAPQAASVLLPTTGSACSVALLLPNSCSSPSYCARMGGAEAAPRGPRAELV